MGKKVVIIGGVACGPKAAARAKRLDPSLEITIIEKDSEVSYGACGLPFYLEGEIKDIKELTTTPVGIPRTPQFFKAVKGVDVITKTEATAIDRKNKIVKIKNLDTQEESEIKYDKLVIATGSRPVKPPIPGIEAKGIYCLKTLHDGEQLKKAIESSKTKKAVIVGAGLIGLECVASLLKYGFEIHIVEKLNWPLPALLDEEIAIHLKNHLEAKGINLHLGDGVEGFEKQDDRVCAVKTEKTKIEADLVLLAIGFIPNVELAKDAGLELGARGIKVDAYMRTSDPDIYAGGDCVETYNIVTNKAMYAPMGSTANKHGRVIGDNLAGRMSRFTGICGTAVCNVLGLNIARTGITQREAELLGLEVMSAITPATDKPHYMKDSKPIITKLIAEKYSRRVLGAQLIGPGEVLSRINTVASIITMKGTIDDIADVDMAYAPPFTPAIDNIIVAANVIQNKLDRLCKTYTPKELKEKIDNKEDIILLDVRTPQEVEQMKLPYENVLYIPLGKLREKLNELPKEKEIVCLCKISLRGYEAARILLGAGFDREKVAFLDGGIVAWPYEKIINPA